MIDPIVRPATVDDAAEIAALEAVARRGLVGERGGDRWLETHAEHGGVGRADRSVWVATIDDLVVGYLVCDLEADVARIVDVFVLPDARELGFGDELLAAAMTASRATGARLLEGESLPGDRDTKNLYERAGIKARLITVSVEL